jgi:hypothetical protein
MAERRMLDLSEPGNTMEARPEQAAATKTMHGLRRLALWGATAAGALLLAALSSRSEVGAERIAVVLHGGPTQVAARTFDAQAETRRLAEALRGLAADDDGVKSRLAAVEHSMDDMTGSISRQIEAAKAAPRPSLEDGPTVQATAAVTASLVTPVAAEPPVAAAAPAAATEYGVDIGGGPTIQALRARWLAIRSAHPQLFEGLEPIVSVRDVPRTNRIELRLVAGPLAHADAARQLCASLAPFRLLCQPTLFDGQRLALR